MAKGQLFQTAILHHPKPTKDELERGVSPKSVIVREPKFVLAGTDKEAGIVTAREIPDNYLDKVEDLEVLVRPF